MRVKIIALICILIGSTIYACEHSEAVQKLLPNPGEYVLACDSLLGGQSSNIFLCHTSIGKWYIFRYYKNIKSGADFDRVLAIVQKAAELHIHPKIYGFNAELQQTLMDYIEGALWPSYTKNSQPYHAAMKTLRILHDALRPEIVALPQAPAPLSVLLNEPILMNNPGMPRQLGLAFNIVKQWNENVAPWLETHATICHGDFKRSNVLLQRNRVEYRPWIIDFDSAAVGHPYFDVVKFSKKVTHEQRMELFKTYLDHEPTQEELYHYKIVDNVLRMVVAIMRFKLALLIQKTGMFDECLSQAEMEQLLESPFPLPSQSTIPLKDPNLKAQQLGAVYALHEFLRLSMPLIS